MAVCSGTAAGCEGNAFPYMYVASRLDDKVYDSCTHKQHTPETTTAGKRFSRTQIALLLTCRRTYNEAVYYLWNQNLFTFVVDAGLPRGNNIDYMNRHVCKSLGKLKNCEVLFRRIRSLVIVIQPGRNPHVELYSERLRELFRVLEYGKHLRNLTLIFNYRIDIRKHDPMHIKPRQIAEAFYPLEEHMVSKIEAGQCRLTILYSTIECSATPNPWGHYTQYPHAMQVISGVKVGPDKNPFSRGYPMPLREPGSRIFPNQPRIFLGSFDFNKQSVRNYLDSIGADRACMERGAYGKDEIALKPIPIPSQTPVGAKILAAVLFAGLLVLSPVTIPASTYAAVRHKRRKGEWR